LDALFFLKDQQLKLIFYGFLRNGQRILFRVF